MYNITNSHTYQELLNRANMSTLNNRQLQDIAVMMYQVKNNLSLNTYLNFLVNPTIVMTYETLILIYLDTIQWSMVNTHLDTTVPIYGQNLINKIGKNPV